MEKKTTTWYLIYGLSPLFDGLMVEGDDQLQFNGVSVLRTVDRSFMLGDRDITYNFQENSFFINKKFLREIENPLLREYTVSNPWGQLLKESKVDLENLEVNMIVFEKCMQVSVVEKQDNNKNKTLYSNYFYKDFDTIEKFIQSYPKEKSEILILDLQELKAAESEKPQKLIFEEDYDG